MLSYLTIGANDLAASSRFYDAVLLPLGYCRGGAEAYSQYYLEGVADKDNGPGTIDVMVPFDGQRATPGNGMMPAFRASDAAKVRDVHAAGLAAGGIDEGAPGTRSSYSATFYVAYLRDPLGNKLAIFTILDAQ